MSGDSSELATFRAFFKRLSFMQPRCLVLFSPSFGEITSSVAKYPLYKERWPSHF
jgi:hypothetical protein